MGKISPEPSDGTLGTTFEVTRSTAIGPCSHISLGKAALYIVMGFDSFIMLLRLFELPRTSSSAPFPAPMLFPSTIDVSFKPKRRAKYSLQERCVSSPKGCMLINQIVIYTPRVYQTPRAIYNFY